MNAGAAPCPFCSPPADRLLWQSSLVYAITDAYPVTPGHALVIPRAHAPTWFDADVATQHAMLEGIAAVKAIIDSKYRPDGYNIGLNVGQAAGQTVFHLHAHVIPRKAGDISDPTGGVRNVIPGRGNFRARGPSPILLKAREHQLVIGGSEDPFLDHLHRHISEASAIDMVVAFIRETGWNLLRGHLQDALDLGAKLRILTGDYLDVTDSSALIDMLALRGSTEIRVFASRGQSFHPKAYLLHHRDGGGVAFIGSSNVSDSALRTGVEWNYPVVSTTDTEGFVGVCAHFEKLFRHPKTQPLTEAWIIFAGQTRMPDADIVFASVQTLGKVQNLAAFDPARFEYIVVDEFHHATASTYQRVLSHFSPKFLLGLTATPDRTDGGDLLALCEENLVYRCDVVDGIRRELLVPYRYFGIADNIDYSAKNIPWRSTRFDEEALTNAWATRQRAQNVLDHYRKLAGARTLAFCCSQRHAEFMAQFFEENGVRCAAVYTGSTAPRTSSLEALRDGTLAVVFAVDMFNEGLDLPMIDTVMMLRPTESRIIWLQQFGRGLRKATGKEKVTVIDYIGNHRTFLIKPEALLGISGGDYALARALRDYNAKELELPPGCEVTYDLAAVDILRALLRTDAADNVQQFYEEYKERHGVRPTAVEAYHARYNPRALRRGGGTWLDFVQKLGDLTAEEKAALDASREFLADLEGTEMSRSYKMVVVRAMLDLGLLPGEVAVSALAETCLAIMMHSPRLLNDLEPRQRELRALIKHLEANPINAWTGAKGTAGRKHFTYEKGTFRTNFTVPTENREAFAKLAREIVDWRLAEYMNRPATGAIVANVKHGGGGAPMIFLHRGKNTELPEGTTLLRVEGRVYQADFVKVALNVLREKEGENNALPSILKQWFGPDAGQSGTQHKVCFEHSKSAGWSMRPVGTETA